MPKKSIHSAPGLFGTVTHRDEKGKKIGESRPVCLEGPSIPTPKEIA